MHRIGSASCRADAIELPKVLFNKYYEAFRHLILSKLYAVDRKADDLLKLAEYHAKQWERARDWHFRVDFARDQSDWYLYRQKTSS